MPYAALKVKIMPTSPDADLKRIEESAKFKIENLDARVHRVEIEPIAFGLNAIIITIAWPESKELDLIENALSQIDEVNSVEIVDFRRAVG
jgi:translation elongation factor aEF-1 beta